MKFTCSAPILKSYEKNDFSLIIDTFSCMVEDIRNNLGNHWVVRFGLKPTVWTVATAIHRNKNTQ